MPEKPTYPATGEPITHPYDRGYWSPETGDDGDDLVYPDHDKFLEGFQQRLTEDEEAP